MKDWVVKCKCPFVVYFRLEFPQNVRLRTALLSVISTLRVFITLKPPLKDVTSWKSSPLTFADGAVEWKWDTRESGSLQCNLALPPSVWQQTVLYVINSVFLSLSESVNSADCCLLSQLADCPICFCLLVHLLKTGQNIKSLSLLAAGDLCDSHWSGNLLLPLLTTHLKWGCYCVVLRRKECLDTEVFVLFYFLFYFIFYKGQWPMGNRWKWKIIARVGLKDYFFNLRHGSRNKKGIECHFSQYWMNK